MKRIYAFATVLLAVCMAMPQAHAASDEVEFFRAAQIDNAQAIRKLLGKGLDPNITEPLRGDTGLIVALREDGNKVVDLLSAHPAINLEATSGNGDTALMMAAYKHNRKAVDTLLAKGAQINRTGWTPLHYAAAGGDTDITKLFLEKGAQVDAKSPNGMTALMIAAREGKDATVKQLLAAGADANLKSAHGWNASQFAMSAERKDIAAIIAAHVKGASPR